MMWINNSFYSSGETKEDSETVDLYFKSVKDKSILRILFEYNANFRLTIFHENMETVGELIQDMCQFIGLNELSSEADFTAEMATFKTTLDAIKQLSDNVTTTTALTDDLTGLKQLMVVVEDARAT
jgi:replicative DNA helicase